MYVAESISRWARRFTADVVFPFAPFRSGGPWHGAFLRSSVCVDREDVLRTSPFAVADDHVFGRGYAVMTSS